jgi:hypothetical protein
MHKRNRYLPGDQFSLVTPKLEPRIPTITARHPRMGRLHTEIAWLSVTYNTAQIETRCYRVCVLYLVSTVAWFEPVMRMECAYSLIFTVTNLVNFRDRREHTLI